MGLFGEEFKLWEGRNLYREVAQREARSLLPAQEERTGTGREGCGSTRSLNTSPLGGGRGSGAFVSLCWHGVGVAGAGWAGPGAWVGVTQSGRGLEHCHPSALPHFPAPPTRSQAPKQTSAMQLKGLIRDL